MPLGSIAVILAFSCGFEAIFAAIGFNRIGVRGGVEVEVDEVTAVDDAGSDFVLCVGKEVDRDPPGAVGLAVGFDACACGVATIGRPCGSA
jgi:hypothetical protein